jgi:tetratricopeptide (TPR) repeat protein
MRTRLAPLPPLLLLPLLLALACGAHRGAAAGGPLAALEEAAARQAGGGQAEGGQAADARALALAGFHALLVQGDAARAGERFEAALAREGGEPYALYGRLLLARRAARPEQALEAALLLVERAPGHPLTVPAARAVLEGTGQSPVLDERVLARVPRVLPGARGDVAQLLRSALVLVHEARGEWEAQAAELQRLGAPQAFTVVGPLSAHSWLELDAALPAERTGSLEGPFTGPTGPVAPRTLPFPDGRLALSDDASPGDVYLVAVDVEVAEASTYVVRALSEAALKVYVDGRLALERRPYLRATGSLAARPVELAAGRHRVLVKLARAGGAGSLVLTLMRADGGAAPLAYAPARGAAPSGWAAAASPAASPAVAPAPAAPAPLPLVFPEAADLHRALLPEAGDALARFVAVRDGLARDGDGARRLLAPLEGVLSSPAFLALRAELQLNDRTVPSKVAHGRTTRDLEAVVQKDAGEVSALLARAALALDADRALDAAGLLEAAQKASAAGGGEAAAGVRMAQARVALALGVEAQADARAREALAAMPGLCDAVALRYEVARRRDAVAEADALLPALGRCPGALTRRADHARLRGQPARAVEALREAAARAPASVAAASQLAHALSAAGRHGEALEALQALRPFWPRNAQVLKRMADVHELAGARKEALALREEALALDGTDLTLRRNLERARTGKELLADEAVDARAAIEAYEKSRGGEDAAAVHVLDAAAVRAFPDGTLVNRIHTIQKVLAQSAVSEVAEVDLPAGAQVLALRTLKPDGRVLEPEVIEGKDTVSLPGVQVGDYVQVEYLLVEAPRAPGQPGFAAAPFYFQLARQPNAWTTYTVIAPRELGMKVDAHNVQVAPVQRQGALDVFRHEARHVPPFLPEPDGPPSGNEHLAWVQVGAGAEGLESLVRMYGDAFVDNGALTFEVEQFAREAAGGRTGLEAVRAVHAAVSRRILGRDGGLSSSAAASLASERGSRLWLLRASLEALGIPTRLALVRTFHADPSAYRFPSTGLLTYTALRAEVPGHGPVWLDSAVRFAPFGELPEAAAGQVAYLMPEPGRPLEQVRTPEPVARPERATALTLALAADGTLTGEGEETYQGFEAAQLAESLESMPPDKRKQAVEQNLARQYRGAQLTRLEVEAPREVGARVVLRYAFRAQPAHAEGEGKLVLAPLTFPAMLGRRYASAGSRTTPLFVGNVEDMQTRVTLTLPEGYTLEGGLEPLEQRTPFGRFRREESLAGRTLTITESYRVERGRIPPARYPAFVDFAGTLDLVQTRDFTLVKR